MEEVKAYYLDEKGETQTGMFKLRRLTTDEATGLYELCQRKNPRTGATVGYDETKYSKYRLAAMIADCPIMADGKAWNVLSTEEKAKIVGKRIEEDVFLYLLDYAKNMGRMKAETENLSERPSDPNTEM